MLYVVRKVYNCHHVWKNKLIFSFTLRWGFTCFYFYWIYNLMQNFLFSEAWYTESVFQILCQLKHLF